MALYLCFSLIQKVFSKYFPYIYTYIYIYFPLNPFLPPKHKTTRVRMLDVVTWITETFQFFKSFSSLCFILYCFYYCIFKLTDLYLLQCLMSDGWQNLAEKCSFQTCYLPSQKVALSWFLCCCLLLFHYVHNFLCLNLYT